MSQEPLSPIDRRFPPTPKGVRQFMLAYPVLIGGGAGWFRNDEWFWWLAVFCLIGWLSAVWQFFATHHRREGYEAALQDEIDREIGLRAMAGSLEPRLQAKFDAAVADGTIKHP